MASPSAAEIIHAFENIISDPEAKHVWVKERPSLTSNDRHLVFFIKPEATNARDGVNVQEVVESVLQKLEGKVDIGGIRVLGGAYLDENNIMAQHYGVINAISRLGRDALTDQQIAEMLSRPEFKDFQDAKVMGGHQILAAEKDLNAAVLSVISDNIRPTRLGPGTYAMPLKVNGVKYIVLSPFHPQQVVPFTNPKNAIIVFECISANTPWKALRGDVCGATDPAKAVSGSIRAHLLANKAQLGMKIVDTGNNGVHMSAGPLEGMVELKRFFGIQENSATNFGAALLAAGASEENIAAWAGNAKISIEGKSVSAFDATEEKDVEEAVKILMDSLAQESS